jgi:hypothetical protein
MSAIDPLVYAYAIVRQHDGGSLMSLSPVEGVDGGQLRTVSCGELAAVISDVPQTEDGAIEDIWRDSERVKHMVLDHHRVLRAMANCCTVLPLRFGAVFSNDDRVAVMLGAQRQRLCEALERLDGAREWGIQVFCDRAALRSRLGEEAPAIRAAREQIAATTAGRAFFLRHKLELALDAEIQNAIDRCVADCRTSLRSAARAATKLKTQAPAIHGQPHEMVWNGAFLVARECEERFFDLIANLKHTYGSSGLDCGCTGPWPPSSFAESSLGANDEHCGRA